MSHFNLSRWYKDQAIAESQDPYDVLNLLEITINDMVKNNSDNDGFLEDLSLLLKESNNNIDKKYLDKKS
jgi:hypothetical protein